MPTLRTAKNKQLRKIKKKSKEKKTKKASSHLKNYSLQHLEIIISYALHGNGKFRWHCKLKELGLKL